jgi:metal-responsive CopG/Arc/MetJ family transcriptional regulator
MALRTVKRVTITLSRKTIQKLEMQIPKNKRSKFIDELINSNLSDEIDSSYEKECQFWEEIRNKYVSKTEKSAGEILRELRDTRVY